MSLRLLIKKLDLRKQILKEEVDALARFAIELRREGNLAAFRIKSEEIRTIRARWEEVKAVKITIEKHICEEEGKEYDPLGWIKDL